MSSGIVITRSIRKNDESVDDYSSSVKISSSFPISSTDVRSSGISRGNIVIKKSPPKSLCNTIKLYITPKVLLGSRISGSMDIGETTLTLYVGYINLDTRKTRSVMCEGCNVRTDEDTRGIKGRKKKSKILSRSGMMKVVDFLHSNIDTLSGCYEVVIEQQIQGVKARASSNVRIEQQIQGYIDTINKIYGLNIKIVIIHSSQKYTKLDGPYGESKEIRKSWSPIKAQELLLQYGEDNDNAHEWISYIRSLPKKDEVGDVITQLYAHYIKEGLI